MIKASAEDMRVPLERTGGMERALVEQKARADQASAALQGMQAQQQQTAAAAQQALRRAAAAQAKGIGASAVVDTRLLGRQTCGVRWARDGLEIVQVPVRSSPWSHRQSPEGLGWFWAKPETWQ